jgi:hypothetical protein
LLVFRGNKNFLKDRHNTSNKVGCKKIILTKTLDLARDCGDQECRKWFQHESSDLSKEVSGKTGTKVKKTQMIKTTRANGKADGPGRSHDGDKTVAQRPMMVKRWSPKLLKTTTVIQKLS